MTWKLKALIAALALCSGVGTAQADGELHIYNWGNYTSPDLIKKFEKTYNVKVTLTDYDSNDTALAKVRAGGHGFDIVVPSANFIPIWVKEGLLLESRPDQMENFKNMDARWVNVPWDPGRHYSVPWQWGTSGPVVDTAIYKGDINTSAIWLDPPAELVGKIDVVPEMNDVMYAAVKYVGGTWCTDDKAVLKKMRDTLKAAKPKWLAMDYGIEKFDTHDYAAAYYYNGAAFRAREVTPTVRFGFPKEGFALFMDSVAVLKDAKNPENAKLFQNFIMDPENAALISNFATYANGITGSEKYMRAGLKDAPELNIPAEFAGKAEWQEICSPEINDLYTKIWKDLLK
jgi:spermidine/putrescine transport system substrate-binding protein